MPVIRQVYRLSNDDYNVKQGLQKRYNIPTNEALNILLKGGGN